MKNHTNKDKVLIKTNNILSILFNIKSSGRISPSDLVEETEKLQRSDAKLVSNLMRVNHAGEVAAQGLYIGHAILAKTEDQKKMMLKMASEEKDHLDWCKQRILELNGRPSIFNPLWFSGSIAIGMLSSMSNDKNALSFIEETEKQVAEHLESHIKKIPITDNKTHSILKKMKSDEEQHGKTANNHGASELPKNIKKLMGITANIMKFISYRI
tara:strand:+ start:351 stop:989 length:639 start_codon:yes stop_codon:yes gene_type:complete